MRLLSNMKLVFFVPFEASNTFTSQGFTLPPDGEVSTTRQTTA
jgi:hypothetical protein